MLALIALCGSLITSPTVLAQTTVPTPPAATDWSVAMSARTRYEDGARYDLIDTRDYSSIRVRALVSYLGFERVKIVAEPQYNKIWGAEPYVPNAGVPSATAPIESVSSSGNIAYAGNMDALTFRSAYLDWSVAPGLNALIGRQVFLYGDQQILGPADWGPYARSFDALRLRYQWTGLTVDAMHAKLVETQTSKNNRGDDKTLDAIYATYAVDSWLKTIDLYHVWVRDNETMNDPIKDKTRNWMFGAYGVRGVFGAGAWTAKFEYAKNFGPPEIGSVEADKYNGMLTARTDYQFSGTYAQKFGAEIFQAGENWRELFPTPFEAMGRTDVLGRRNVAGGALHWTGTWGERWTTGIDALYFRRVGQGTTVFQPDGRTAVGQAGLTSMDLGTEIDLTARFALTRQMSLGAGYAVLFSGAYLNDSVNSLKPPTYLYAVMELRQ